MRLIAFTKKILEFLSKLSTRSRQKVPELMLSKPSLAIVVDRSEQWVENSVFFAQSLSVRVSVRVRVQVRSDVVGKRFVIERFNELRFGKCRAFHSYRTSFLGKTGVIAL